MSGGKLQHRDEFGKWYSTRDIWDSKDGQITAVVIDDELLPFRKALAEDRIVQYDMRQHYPNVEDWEDKLDLTSSSKFMHEPSYYRIKPNEPKFKVGQWVRYISNPSYIEQFDGADPQLFNPWKPEPNDYCWEPYYGLVKVIEQNSTGDYKCKIIFGSTAISTYNLSGLEPFIGTLPLNLQN